MIRYNITAKLFNTKLNTKLILNDMKPFWNIFLRILKAIIEIVDKVVPNKDIKK